MKTILPASKTTTIVFRFTIFLALAILSKSAQAATCGSLAAVQGIVDVLRTQVKTGEEANRYIVQGKNFLSLECDDIVVTRAQSIAKIIFANGKISMGPDSRIEIAGIAGSAEKPNINIVNLAYGKVRALIQKKSKEEASVDAPTERREAVKPGALTPQSSFQIRTHTAVAGVRGTDFFVGYDPNSQGTEQATLTGRVEVEQKESHQKVLVSAGQQVGVEASTKADDLSTGAKKKLIAIPIQESLKHDLRIASAVAKDDKDFSSEQAVKFLGSANTWTIEKEAIPSQYKDLKNEF